MEADEIKLALQVGQILLPVVLEAVKNIQAMMEKKGMTLEEVIALLEKSKDLPELDFGVTAEK